MNLGERYYQLSLLGRVSFLEAVAPGALVVRAAAIQNDVPPSALGTGVGDLGKGSAPRRNPFHQRPMALNTVASLPSSTWQRGAPNLHILPLTKVPGTPFVDLITLGRTAGNDVRLDDHTVSRFHAFFRQRVGSWFMCDAGSKNGTRVAGMELAPRTEAKLASGALINFGSVEVTFYGSDSLFDLLTQGE